MISVIKSEVRKVLTVRATYGFLAAAFLIAVPFVAFYIYGYRDASHAALSANALLTMLYQVAGLCGLLLAFIGILSVGNEYRYNTILYSLTTISRRLYVFFAKWLVVVVFALVAATLIMLCAWLAFYEGQHGAHIPTVQQLMPNGEFWWRALVGVVGEVSFAYIIAMLIRSQVGSIAFFLIVPSTAENLLGILLKDNVKYLPFTALSNITSLGSGVPVSQSLEIVLGYVAVFGLLAAALFVERDAN